MEVHHHSHKPKNWKEYITEFLMLFAAVTLGFFAENIREHIAENNKKKELMNIVSLDLQRDLNQLEFHKKDISVKLATCDSLYPVLKLDPKKVYLKLYYRLLINHLAYWDFNSNNKSRNEADAKGYFRNNEDAELAYNISKVNFFLQDYKTLEEEAVRLRTKLKELSEDMTEHQYYDNCISLNIDLLPNTIGIKAPDAKAAKKTAYLISNFKLMYSGCLGDIDSIKIYSSKAIELINKKYK